MGDDASAASLDGLRDLIHALQSSRSFVEVLEIAAERARAALGGDSLSLSEWDRDLGRLVTRVNVGALAPDEVRFPTEEAYLLTRDAMMLLEGNGFLVQAEDDRSPEPDRSILIAASMTSGITMPLSSEGRWWGELWVTREPTAPAYDGADLVLAAQIGELIGEVVASGQMLERTARMAFEDPLTRLGNRRVFDDRLAELLETGTGPGATLVLCDLDGLKEINDDAGHATGDRVITLAADALSVVASRVEGAVATRIGGDEFALLLPGEVRADAVTMAHRAADLLARGREHATISCGVASGSAGTTSRAVMATADAALYAAKRRGARVVLASDLPRQETKNGPEPDSDLVPLRRLPLRRRWDDQADRPYAADTSAAVADAVRALAEALPDRPGDVPGALRWIGDALLGPLDLDRWVLSRVTLADQPRTFMLDSLGLRQSRLPAPSDAAVRPRGPLTAQSATGPATSPLLMETFPQVWAAVEGSRMFTLVSPADGEVESPEQTALREMGIRFAVGAAATDAEHAWLFALYSANDRVPLEAVVETTALALAAAGLDIQTDVNAPHVNAPDPTQKDGPHD